MKKISLLIIAAISFSAKSVQAQCNFTPTIVPDPLIFCPNETDTLATQVYDTYQWYKNGKPIAGATQRTLVVHQQTDQGYLFRVAVTKNGCSDTSKRVLADGYAFNPPDIIEGGDIGVFDPNIDALVECPQDTLKLAISGGYVVNVQWYNNYKPIKGATNPAYDVTKNGSYTVCGAQEICPNFIQCESLPLNAVFENPVATISQKNDTLFASSAKKYQWFFLNKKIAGATQSYYVPQTKGVYSVITKDKYTCLATSKPYYFTPNNKNIFSVSPNPVKDVLHVHVNTNDAKQIVIFDLYGNQKLRISINANDETISLQNIYAGTYVVQILNYNAQKIASATIIKQ
jgi:hypothetical protein